MSNAGQISQSAPRRWLQMLAGNLGWLLASNALMAVLSLIYIGIITRSLGITDFGRFALITSAAQMLTVLASFETWKIIVQYGLEHEAKGDAPAMVRLVQASIGIELISARTEPTSRPIGCTLSASAARSYLSLRRNRPVGVERIASSSAAA